MPDNEINSDTDDDEEERLADTLLGDSFQDDGDSDGDSDGDDEDFEESNLIPDDDTSDSDADSDGADGESYVEAMHISELMTKCRAMVGTIRRASILHETVNTIANDLSINVDLILDMRVRWNSSYKMINRILVYQSVLEELYGQLDNIGGITKRQKEKLIGAHLSSSDWALLQSLRFVLERFSDATEIISGKSYPTLSIAYAVRLSLHHFLSDLTGDTNVRAIKKMLLAQYQHYMTVVTDSKHDNMMSAAALLDPTTHDMVRSEDRVAAEKFLVLEVHLLSQYLSFRHTVIWIVRQSGYPRIRLQRRKMDLRRLLPMMLTM